MTRRSKLLMLVSGVPIVLIAIILLYLGLADLSKWRDPVARMVSGSLGREMAIDGIFELDVGLNPRVTAGDITLVNADWGSQATMLSIDHLELKVNLLSVFFGPFRIESLKADGIRAVLETDQEGNSNWSLRTGYSDAGNSPSTELSLGTVDLNNIELSFRDGPPGRQVDMGIDTLGIRGDDTDMLDLHLDGNLEQRNLSVEGRLGRFGGLLQGKGLVFDLKGQLGDTDFVGEGQIADLRTLDGVGLRVGVHGVDLAGFGRIFGVTNAGSGLFEAGLEMRQVTGGTGFDVALSGGGVDATLAGTVDSLVGPGMFDVGIEASGRDVAIIGKFLGVEDLPAEEFSISGHGRWEGFPISFDNAEVHVGENVVLADGVLGKPPLMTGTDFTFTGTGPDVSSLMALAGIKLPNDSFSVDGHLVRLEHGIAFNEVEVGVGRTVLKIDGIVGDPPEYAGTSLTISGSTPNLAHFQGLSAIELPAEPFTFTGMLARGDEIILLESVNARLGSTTIDVDGHLSTERLFTGTDLRIHLEDPDGGHLASIAGIADVPASPLSLGGRFRVQTKGYQIDELQGVFEDMSFEANGRFGPITNPEDAEFRVALRGPRLSKLSTVVGGLDLPETPFAVTGLLRKVADNFQLEGTTLHLTNDSLRVDGLIVPGAGLAGTDLKFKIAGPSLKDAGRLVPSRVDLLDLPAAPYSASGRMVIDESGYLLEEIEAVLADATTRVDGHLGRWPTFSGTDLSVVADGANAALFRAFTGMTLPELPFRLGGRVERLDSATHLQSCWVQLGRSQFRIDGLLGDRPHFIGTDLEVHAEGPSLSLVRNLFGVEQLPGRPFFLDGHFEGTTEGFSATSLVARVGPSDLSGSFTVDLMGKPTIQAEIKSTHLDLSPLLGFHRRDNPPPMDTMETSAAENPRFLIPDRDIDLAFFQETDGQVRVRVKDLILPGLPLHDFEVDFRVDDGRLEIAHMTATHQSKGSLVGSLFLEPEGGIYRLRTQVQIRNIRANLRGSTIDLPKTPPINIDVDIESAGATFHDLAGSANGRLQIVAGQGELDNSTFDLLTTDILVKILRILNPFTVKDKVTGFRCAVLDINLENGLARIEPLAIQTDKVTILGKGEIDLATESLDLEWVSKPREGFGLSATMITNPYIKLGGTLSNPSVQLKELQAVASTGVAVATLGLSIVAKALFDRVTADRDVCRNAIEAIAERSGESVSAENQR